MEMQPGNAGQVRPLHQLRRHAQAGTGRTGIVKRRMAVENLGLMRRPHFNSPDRKRGCPVTSSRKKFHWVRLLKSRWSEISASSAISSGAYAGE